MSDNGNWQDAPPGFKVLTAREVAAIFRLDVRTVRRYYKAFGGVRIGRAIRFFDNRIASMNDAYFHRKEERLPETLEGTGLDGRQDGRREMVRFDKGRSEGGHCVGRADKEGSAGGQKASGGDPFGLLPS